MCFSYLLQIDNYLSKNKDVIAGELCLMSLELLYCDKTFWLLYLIGCFVFT